MKPYALVHNHRYGNTYYFFKTNRPSQDDYSDWEGDLVKLFDIDYSFEEADYWSDEFLEIFELNESEVKTLI